MGYREKYFKEHPVEKVLDKVGVAPVEIHHIKPRSEGGSDRVSNLMSLPSHVHKAEHRGDIDIRKRIKNSWW